ncbi:nucleolar MIF4G domain-containing protein 1 isoform X3 [Cavia porcellus]|uniref:nucleolar MIF4G domain-containing protein 1 isoform X3 n=1 Tax=Cavia porcellus TaxID=10141 RepID=UPI002FE113F1
MAAPTKLALSGRKGGASMKRDGGGPGGQGALKRLKLAVEGFVRTNSEGEAPGGYEGRAASQRSRTLGRKSRKELRREKRQLRKARRLQLRKARRLQRAGRLRTAEEESGAFSVSRAPEAEAAPAHSKAEVKVPVAKPKAPAAPAPSAHSKAKATRTNGPPLKAEGRPGKARPSATAAARKRALLAANEEEDREIRKLERCLGLNKRKKKGDSSSVPLSFTRDGLDYILGALEPGTGGGGLYESSGEEDETLPESDLDGDCESESEDDAEGQAPSAEDEEAHEDVESGAQETTGRKRVRFVDEDLKDENSKNEDTAPQESLCESSEKYIPPQGRQALETVDVHKKLELERLKKQVKGLINRLSEPNMAFISGQLEELYMAHSRKDMSDTLTATLMDACVTSSTMPSRLMMEHVLLVSILHHTVGIESLLIFDILKKLVETFTEKDIELILLMLKNVGFSLRKDNALSLKELITEAQAKASAAGSRFQDQTRIRFMLETMLALKNNDMRKIPGYDPEPVERLRKLQRTLIRSAGSGSETQLRVSWDSILNAEQTGRWWIVGSAWSGAPMIDSCHRAAPQQPLGTVSAKMLQLARKQRMNTDVRRNIFCTVMTSEDFLDAFEKLLKLGLKDQQEREIVHVLMDCCLQEKSYNPFYAFLASKFCGYERRFQMTFQFSIWDKFRDLENLPDTKFLNLVHLVAHLLKTKSLPLSILKVVEFSELDKPRVHFLRRVLTMLLMEAEVEDLSLIFSRVSDNPKLGVLREGLKLFISHFLLRPAQAQRSPEEAAMLRERAGLATKALQGRAAPRI